MRQASPRPSFEVIQSQLFLRLRVQRLARPSGLDVPNNLGFRRPSGVVGHVILDLSTAPFLPDNLHELARKVTPARIFDSIRDPGAPPASGPSYPPLRCASGVAGRRAARPGWDVPVHWERHASVDVPCS